MRQAGTPKMTRVAECCCAQLSIELNGEPEMHGVCHCDDCKKRTGSAFSISAYFKTKEKLNIVGHSNQYSFYHKEQDHEQTRHFCSKCGTTLYWFVSSHPDLIGVAGGCFVKKPLGKPKYSTRHSKKCSWVKLGWGIEKDA